MPSRAALVFSLKTSFVFSASRSPQAQQRLVKFSFHAPNDATAKSNSPPTKPATSSGLAWLPPRSPEMSTWVEAVASGKGYFPCMSFTKYLRKGIRKRMPRMPPRSEAMNTSRKLTVISGYFACRMYKAGSVKMAPATIMPEQAPMLWIMTFSPRGSFRWVAPATPTAMMVMGMAASNTWPTFKPK